MTTPLNSLRGVVQQRAAKILSPSIATRPGIPVSPPNCNPSGINIRRINVTWRARHVRRWCCIHIRSWSCDNISIPNSRSHADSHNHSSVRHRRSNNRHRQYQSEQYSYRSLQHLSALHTPRLKTHQSRKVSAFNPDSGASSILAGDEFRCGENVMNFENASCPSRPCVISWNRVS